jgi:hypothetical protein
MNGCQMPCNKETDGTLTFVAHVWSVYFLVAADGIAFLSIMHQTVPGANRSHSQIVLSTYPRRCTNTPETVGSCNSCFEIRNFSRTTTRCTIHERWLL